MSINLGHHIWCNYPSTPVENCWLCKKLNENYPEIDYNPKEMLREYFPDIYNYHYGNTKNLISIKQLHPDAKVPTRGSNGAAGWDLYSIENVDIEPGQRKVIKTGISMAIPAGYVGLIWPRSGLAVKQGIDVLAGVIDSDYRGEILVCLLNTSNAESVLISKGDRIAQILFQEVPKFSLEQVDELNTTQRNDGGFGSSGV